MLVRNNSKKQKGFTILEYCAGAAIILGVVWGAMQGLGTSTSNLIGAIGSWADSRATSIRSGDTTGTK